jgi:HK97 family phage major capsid protein
MSMTVAEAQQEIKNRLNGADLIEKKYPDPETMPNEERDQVKNLLSEVDELESKLAGLEDAEERRNRITRSLERHSRPAPNAFRPSYGGDNDAPQGKRMSPGQQFLASMEYRQIKQTGRLNSNNNRIDLDISLAEGTSLIDWSESKALLRGGSTTSGQAFVLEDHQPGYLDILQAPLNILGLIPRTPTESDTIEYVSETTFTNSAAFTAEATGFTATSLGGTGVKPESALAYSTSTATVRALAHWLPVTNRMLNDAPAIRGIIDQRLLFGLQKTLQAQVVSGGGTGEDLTGILNASGVQVQGLGTDSRIDALYKGRTLVAWTGYGRPNAYVMNPTDWQTIRLSRESAASATPGSYLFGPPSGTGFDTLWGIPVVLDPNMTAGTALVGDFNQGCTLFDREQGNIRVGTINDQMIKNMQTILAELRVAFVVWRGAVFAKITGL